MSGKKRWWIAIISSLIINAFLLLIASYQIIQQKPLEKLPEEPQLTEVFMDDDSASPEDEPSTGRGETQVVANDENDIALPDNKQEKAADNQAENNPGGSAGEGGGPAPNPDRPKRYMNLPPTQSNMLSMTPSEEQLKQLANPPKIESMKDSFAIPQEVLPYDGPISVEVKYQIMADGKAHANITKSSGKDAIDDEALRTIYEWQFTATGVDFPISQTANFVRSGDGSMMLLRK